MRDLALPRCAAQHLTGTTCGRCTPPKALTGLASWCARALAPRRPEQLRDARTPRQVAVKIEKNQQDRVVMASELKARFHPRVAGAGR